MQFLKKSGLRMTDFWTLTVINVLNPDFVLNFYYTKFLEQGITVCNKYRSYIILIYFLFILSLILVLIVTFTKFPSYGFSV